MSEHVKNEELLPCPFCGSKAIMLKSQIYIRGYFLKCSKCPCEMSGEAAIKRKDGYTCGYLSQKQMINRWNTRTTRTEKK